MHLLAGAVVFVSYRISIVPPPEEDTLFTPHTVRNAPNKASVNDC